MKPFSFILGLALCGVGFGLPTHFHQEGQPPHKVVRFEPETRLEAVFSFIKKAPEYIADSLKHPETSEASSRILPIFWIRGPQDNSKSTASQPESASTSGRKGWVVVPESFVESYLLYVLTYASILALLILVFTAITFTAQFLARRTYRLLVRDTEMRDEKQDFKPRSLAV